MEDLSRFVLIGREKYTAVRAEIRAIDKLKLAEEVRNQKNEEATMLAEALLDAEARLGELFKKIPKAVNQYKSAADSDVDSKTKKEVVENLGFSQKQAERFETLAENPDIVEYVKAEARENGEFPTRARVLELASEKNKQEDVRIPEEPDESMDLKSQVYTELSKIHELIADFEITPHRMEALRDNFDAVIRPDDHICYMNESIDKLQKIRLEIYHTEKSRQQELIKIFGL